jgi:hypothetical protein
MTITICTPVFGTTETASVSLTYHKAWARLPLEKFPTVNYINCDLVRARSRGVRAALENGSSHVLMWDADVGGDTVPEVLQGLIDAKVDLIGAPYARKNLSGKSTWSADGGHLGMGFTLISRSCMQKMTAHYGSTLSFLDKTDDGKVVPTVALFQLFLTHNALLGEDYSFCERWKQIGGSVYLYSGPGLPLDHVGNAVYR